MPKLNGLYMGLCCLVDEIMSLIFYLTEARNREVSNVVWLNMLNDCSISPRNDNWDAKPAGKVRIEIAGLDNLFIGYNTHYVLGAGNSIHVRTCKSHPAHCP